MRYTTLISAAELAAHSGATDLLIIDCRHDLLNPDAGLAAYRTAHIAQAQFAHVDLTMSGAKIGADGKFKGRHPLPQRQDFVAAMQALGVNDTTQVVAYDAQGGMYAARLWWLLRWIGHTQVAVLDGGLQAWQAQAGAMSTTNVPAIPGTVQEKPALVNTIEVDAVLTNIGSRRLTVVDARAADRYRGENETIDAVGGHIPGAKNRFFKDNLDAEGHFKPAQVLHAEWSNVLERAQDAVMQCGSGVTACHNLLALEVAGMPGATLYPGSWSEWSADPSRPVATGSQP